MKITLTGASGFIGGALVARLKAKDQELTILGRRDPDLGARYFLWDSIGSKFPMEAVEGSDAIIHLAGEPVARRWNDDVKRRIRESRVHGTNAVVEAIAKAVAKPKVLIAASAIGFYGERGEEILTEQSKPGRGFLPEVCVDWEDGAMAAEKLGVRVVLPRIGVALHHSGGALAQMLPPFKMGVGGPVGGGEQWMSWIHRDDLVSMILWCLHDESVMGPVNGVSPNPCRNREFSKKLGSVLSRPAMMPVPAFALKVMYGEMASVILSSQRVLPGVPGSKGFQFQYPDLELALRAAV